MSSYQTLALGSAVLCGAASIVAYWLGARVFHNSGWFIAIGKKLHAQKLAQMDRQPLKYYRDAASQGKFWRGFTIIAAAILFKSVVCGLMGVLIIFYLPLGVLVIPALARQHGERDGMRRWVAQVTVLQASSHVLAAGVGFSATWLWWRTDIGPLEPIAGEPAFTVALLSASLIVGLVAAWVETTGHIRDGYLEPTGCHRSEAP